jgi:hypothetical protein
MDTIVGFSSPMGKGYEKLKFKKYKSANSSERMFIDTLTQFMMPALRQQRGMEFAVRSSSEEGKFTDAFKSIDSAKVMASFIVTGMVAELMKGISNDIIDDKDPMDRLDKLENPNEVIRLMMPSLGIVGSTIISPFLRSEKYSTAPMLRTGKSLVDLFDEDKDKAKILYSLAPKTAWLDAIFIQMGLEFAKRGR